MKKHHSSGDLVLFSTQLRVIEVFYKLIEICGVKEKIDHVGINFRTTDGAPLAPFHPLLAEYGEKTLAKTDQLRYDENLRVVRIWGVIQLSRQERETLEKHYASNPNFDRDKSGHQTEAYVCLIKQSLIKQSVGWTPVYVEALHITSRIRLGRSGLYNDISKINSNIYEINTDGSLKIALKREIFPMCSFLSV